MNKNCFRTLLQNFVLLPFSFFLHLYFNILLLPSHFNFPFWIHSSDQFLFFFEKNSKTLTLSKFISSLLLYSLFTSLIFPLLYFIISTLIQYKSFSLISCSKKIHHLAERGGRGVVIFYFLLFNILFLI